MKFPACFILISLMLGGCASAPRKVSLPEIPPQATASGRVSGSELVVALADQRTDRTIDAILDVPVTNSASAAVKRALLQSKAFQLDAAAAPRIEVTGEIRKLEWFVPGYDAMLKKVFVTSFLTGGLGGVAYGSTDTPVEGHAAIHFLVKRGDDVLVDDEYSATHQEKMAKLKCDTFTTKSRMAASALGKVVDLLIADLDKQDPKLSVAKSAR